MTATITHIHLTASMTRYLVMTTLTF